MIIIPDIPGIQAVDTQSLASTFPQLRFWIDEKQIIGKHFISFLVSGVHTVIVFSLVDGQGDESDFHSLRPMHNGQEVSDNRCVYLNRQPCYYHASYDAERMATIYHREGIDGLWMTLARDLEAFTTETWPD